MAKQSLEFMVPGIFLTDIELELSWEMSDTAICVYATLARYYDYIDSVPGFQREVMRASKRVNKAAGAVEKYLMREGILAKSQKLQLPFVTLWYAGKNRKKPLLRVCQTLFLDRNRTEWPGPEEKELLRRYLIKNGDK